MRDFLDSLAATIVTLLVIGVFVFLAALTDWRASLAVLAGSLVVMWASARFVSALVRRGIIR